MRLVTSPADIIKEEYLKPLNISNSRLATLLNVTNGTVSRLLSGKCSMSTEMALRFSKVFGTTAMFWVNLQTSYDISLAKQNKDLQAKLDKLKPFHEPTITEDNDDD